MQLVIENWQALGIKAYVKPLQRQVLRNRIFAGETLMAIWFGLENGIPSADMSPYEFAPTTQQQYQWPKWGQYYETRGQAGAPPDLPEAKQLLELYNAWRVSRTTEERRAIWHQILAIYSAAGLLDRHHRRRPAAGRGRRAPAQPARGRRSSTGSPAPSSASTARTPSGSRTGSSKCTAALPTIPPPTPF